MDFSTWEFRRQVNEMYAVLITGLGYLNLTRVSRLQMARRYRRLNESEERELASADPRDKAAARWYGWVQVAGVALAAFYFAAFFAPAGIQLVRWAVTGLTTAPATSLRFWTVLVSGWVAALPIIIPPLTYMRDRRRKSAGYVLWQLHELDQLVLQSGE